MKWNDEDKFGTDTKGIYSQYSGSTYHSNKEFTVDGVTYANSFKAVNSSIFQFVNFKAGHNTMKVRIGWDDNVSRDAYKSASVAVYLNGSADKNQVKTLTTDVDYIDVEFNTKNAATVGIGVMGTAKTGATIAPEAVVIVAPEFAYIPAS